MIITLKTTATEAEVTKLRNELEAKRSCYPSSRRGPL